MTKKRANRYKTEPFRLGQRSYNPADVPTRSRLREASTLLQRVLTACSDGDIDVLREVFRDLYLFEAEIKVYGPGAIEDAPERDFWIVVNTLEKVLVRTMRHTYEDEHMDYVFKVPHGVWVPVKGGFAIFCDVESFHEAFVFQVLQLLRIVGWERLQVCACQKVFVKAGRREYCSEKCFRRFYMRRYRADPPMEEHNAKARTR